MSEEEVLRFLMREYKISIEDYGNLNDYQIKVLCSGEDKNKGPDGVNAR